MITSIPETLHICDGCQDQLVEGRTDRIVEQARPDLARARRNTRRAIVGLICGPGVAALGILALPYLFRAVFFLEGVLGGGR